MRAYARRAAEIGRSRFAGWLAVASVPVFLLSILPDPFATTGFLLILPMVVIAAIHLTLMNLKARNEEHHLFTVHGEAYQRYLARTGRFFPRLSSRDS